MRARTFLLGLSLLAVPLLPCYGASPTAPVSMTFHEKNGHFDIKARFQVAADREQVWEVLTDFENYPKLSNELKKVTVTRRTSKNLVVEEMAESGFLFITQKVYFTLDVGLSPGRSITATDTGHKNFVSYRYRWDVEPDQDGENIDLTYHLQAEGHFDGPAFMVNDHFQGGVKNFLEALRREILRRQAERNKQGKKG